MESQGRKYRILLLGDYSNMHSQLGKTLSAMGHDVTVMSDGCGFMDTSRTVDIRRRPGRLGGALLYARLRWPLHSRLSGYDIVAIQHPNFVQLRTGRLRILFDRLRADNGRVFLTAAGTDPVYIRECQRADSPLLYNEFRVGNRPTAFALSQSADLDSWLSPGMIDYTEHVYSHVDGVVTALYEYDVAVRRLLGDSKVHYGGIPIDTGAVTPVPMDFGSGKTRIFLGRHAHRVVEKGTDILEQAARRVCERHPDSAELVIVENRPYAEYVQLMRSSHIVLDQLYSYTPATNALLAMAAGMVAVSGGEEDYYRFIGECGETPGAGSPVLRPIVNARPDDLEALVAELSQLVCDHDRLRASGAQGPEFVKRHNDAYVVAQRFLQAWTKTS